MAVVEAVSTNGKYKTYTSENATLATVLSEVLNELDTQNKSMSNTQFQLTWDATSNKYAFLAVVKGG
jgi:hypothetical protein